MAQSVADHAFPFVGEIEPLGVVIDPTNIHSYRLQFVVNWSLLQSKFEEFFFNDCISSDFLELLMAMTTRPVITQRDVLDSEVFRKRDQYARRLKLNAWRLPDSYAIWMLTSSSGLTAADQNIEGYFGTCENLIKCKINTKNCKNR